MSQKTPPSDQLFLDRAVDLRGLVAKKSYFLFGPRQTGKSSLIAHTLPNVRIYDLLDTATFLSLSQNPGRLAQEVTQKSDLVVIDEIQRLPELLNEVHRLIESQRIRFLLTGSSARKLRRGGVNLLGGRARTQHLHPLTSRELGNDFTLSQALKYGTLPSIYFSDDPQADLNAYVGTYLQQEIVAEGAARSVPAFSRFLSVAALCNGTVVNFSNVGRDAQVPRTTVHEYFEILKDTLILHELPAWRLSKKRKPLVSSKYYFFDVGVVGALQGRPFQAGTPEYGQALETYLFHELQSYHDYRGGDPVSFWRSTSGFEVDFLIGDHTAVEVKTTSNVASQDLKALKALAEETIFRRYFCVSFDPRPRQVGNLTILPVQTFLENLWGGAYR